MIERYSQKRKAEGQIGEQIVSSILEQVRGEPLTKTKKENDTLDFETPTAWIEIKRRLAPYSSTDKYFEEGALLPLCKFARACEEEKPVYFYYYFDTDKTLWELKFDPEFFVLFKPIVPRGHIQHQPHLCIPKKFWKQIEYNHPA